MSFYVFRGSQVNIGSLWVRTRLIPKTNLERDWGILHGARCSDTRQNKVLIFHQ